MPPFLVFLKAVPLQRWLEVGLVVLILAFGLVQHERIVGLKADLATTKLAVATEKQGRADDRAAADHAAALTAIDRAKVSDQRYSNVQEIDRESTRIELARHADAVAAAAADGRLRDAFRAAAAPAGSGPRIGDSGSVGVGETAPAAVDLRADVFGESDGRSGELADALDQAHARGLGCEHEHAALKHPLAAAGAMSAPAP